MEETIEPTRKQIAEKLIPRYEKNISFMEERIRIQNEPNFSNWVVNGWGGYPMRTYCEIEVTIEKEKLAFAKTFVN